MREVDFGLRKLIRGIGLPSILISLMDSEGDSAALRLHLGADAGLVGFGLGDLGFHGGSDKNRDLNRRADLSVVALEAKEILVVIVVLGEQRVLSDQVNTRRALRLVAFDFVPFRLVIRFETLQL